MLDESQLDEFLDEFFGEEKPASDAARLKNSGKQNPFHRKEVPSEELEEYTLPSDGMIIRQMEQPGKGKPAAPWFAFAGHADRGTNPSILLGEDMGRAKIPALQPDRGNGSHASLFYDV